VNILVIGGGGREHAIAWKLSRSGRNPRLFVAPGNAGTAAIATNLPVKADDVDGLAMAARDHHVDLAIVGPDGALAAGVVDRFRDAGLPAFGPLRAAARLEWSKSFAKQVMAEVGVPTAAFRVFDDAASARAYVREHGAPTVVKADGLALGKGVVVARTVEEALAAVDDMMVRRVFGAAGDRVVIEEALSGQEVSVFCFTDGQSSSPLVAACDYKRVFDGDRGPNTGGMGGYSPPPFWSAELERKVQERCIRPVLAALAKAGTPYTGVLYGGLMLTADGPRVIEFNARFGDPESQLILPRLENDLIDVVEAVVAGKVSSLRLRWSKATVGVVIASGGYPGDYPTGLPIAGLDHAAEVATVFHAGTARKGDAIVTAGGRVLIVVGQGEDLAEARALAYEGAARISFANAHYRRDIASFAGERA